MTSRSQRKQTLIKLKYCKLDLPDGKILQESNHTPSKIYIYEQPNTVDTELD